MTDPCDHPGLLPVDEALRRLWEALPSRGLGPLHAERDDPATDRSAMDGVALRASDGAVPRRLLGTIFAGDDPAKIEVTAGSAVRIMTGGAMPSGADAVVPVEVLRVEEGWVHLGAAPQAGDHVRRRGKQAKAGDLLLRPDTPFTSARIGLMAQEGHSMPWPVRVRVGVASTGDEIVAEPAPHQIRDANGPMLVALAEGLGAEARLHAPLPDDMEALQATLRACGDVDILMTSGGVSMGEKDHLPKALANMGANILFHRIDLRPGKPMLVALLGNLLVLGLPGNPVSSYVNARLFLEVALARLQGRPWPEPWHEAVLRGDVSNPGSRPLLHPCALRVGGLEPLRSQGSADLAALAKADACAWIPSGGARSGDTVRWISVV